jgi:hypothetical protein
MLLGAQNTLLKCRSCTQSRSNTWQTNASLTIEELCSTPGNFALFTNPLRPYSTGQLLQTTGIFKKLCIKDKSSENGTKITNKNVCQI